MKHVLHSLAAGLVATASALPIGAAADGPVVGMALPCKKNDRGFCQAHHIGLQKAVDELRVDPRVIDNSLTPEDWVTAMASLAEDSDLIIGVGAQFDEAGKIVAPEFPDKTFMVINGSVDPDIPNLHAYGIRQGVPAYIAGVVAGALDGVETLGYVGGLEIPPVTQSDDAARAGAKIAGVEYLSTITGDFNDVALAKSATDAQIAEGADAVYGMLAAGLTGMVQAAQRSDRQPYLFGAIIPRCEDYDNMVGTAVAGSPNLVMAMIGDYQNGTIPAKPQFYGVEEPSIQRFELCPNFQTEELEKLVDDITNGIVDGSITLPDGV